jgi:endonuclease III related protein
MMMSFYEALFGHYGPQRWWPGETPFEVMVGAVLTQNTNWNNVEKAIGNLKAAGLLEPWKLHRVDGMELARLIRPAGYYNIKTRRLKNLVRWLCEQHEGRIENLESRSVEALREELLAVSGVGRETADSILLYALNKPIFVVDAYTYRVLVRHRCIAPESDYDEVREYCQSKLGGDRVLFNEFHALLVRVGKEYCRPSPQCLECPLNAFPHDSGEP